MQPLRSIVALAGVAVIGFLGSGCGSDDEPAEATSSAAPTTNASTPEPTAQEAGDSKRDGEISTTEFVARADEVCADREPQMVAAFTALQNPGSDLASLATVLGDAGNAVSALTAELDSVPLPSDGADADAAAYVDNLNSSAIVIDQARAAASRNDQAAVEAAVLEFGRLADETGRLGADLGFKRCGQAGA